MTNLFRSAGMNTGTLALGAVAAVLVLAGSADASALVNGDFESPNSGTQWLTTSLLTGWTWTPGPGGSVDLQAQSDAYGLPTLDGGYYVSFGGNGTYGGSITQTFATTPGAQYTISYLVAESQGDDPAQVLEAILVNGAQTLTEDNSALTMSFLAGKSITFTATGASATLTFLDATPAGYGGPSNIGLDTVTLNGSTGGVPEPATWAVMLLGFAIAGAAARRRRGLASVAA